MNSPAFLDHLLAPPDAHVILSGDSGGSPQPGPGAASTSSASNSNCNSRSNGNSSSSSGGSGRDVSSSGSSGQEEILPVSESPAAEEASADGCSSTTRVINSGGERIRWNNTSTRTSMVGGAVWETVRTIGAPSISKVVARCKGLSGGNLDTQQLLGTSRTPQCPLGFLLKHYSWTGTFCLHCVQCAPVRSLF